MLRALSVSVACGDKVTGDDAQPAHAARRRERVSGEIIDRDRL